uniref:Uridine 5'-monophosphate synthase n=1 Tax=Phallusia mammillata TaxID=59560 RepID=A0A6F9DX09_9ASCI|nr:uridine 5'-monophosphate synthase-like [Phallusia mammillata]
MLSREELVLRLFEIEAVKFGSFTLKSGIVSPVYVDLRVMISYPSLLKEVSELLWKKAEEANVQYKSLCGVPYTALPMATCISVDHDIPMLIRRKEAKDYGTKKKVEGNCEKDSVCLIIEDVVTTGSSVYETAEILEEAGVRVTDAIVLLDREQGGKANLCNKNITLHSVFTLTGVMKILVEKEKIKPNQLQEVKSFLAKNNSFKPSTIHRSLSFRERGMQKQTHPVARRLFDIMEQKQTNLCFSADVDNFAELLELADKIGQYICCIKTHVDIMEDFSAQNIKSLKELSVRHNFLIFEDRKFADIGNTVRSQYTGGIYKISDWCDITNAHSLPGPGIVSGLKSSLDDKSTRACLLIAEMSSQGNLADSKYKQSTVEMASEHGDFVIGFICTSKVSENPSHIHFTPGVKLINGVDGFGQKYLTPDEVIRRRGSDVIIVGRGITESANRIKTAKEFQEAGWMAYNRR